MAAVVTFRVQIYYREPGYEARNGPKPGPYSWTYLISARSAGEAQRIALDEFRQTER